MPLISFQTHAISVQLLPLPHTSTLIATTSTSSPFLFPPLLFTPLFHSPSPFLFHPLLSLLLRHYLADNVSHSGLDDRHCGGLQCEEKIGKVTLQIADISRNRLISKSPINSHAVTLLLLTTRPLYILHTPDRIHSLPHI